MTWLIWRRQRTALLGLAALTAATIVVLAVGRLTYTSAIAQSGIAADCLADPACATPALFDISARYALFWGLGHSFLLVFPLSVGLLAGSAVFGRDVEDGTHVFALTQEASHRRWFTTGLLLCGSVALAAAAVVSVVAGWAYAPFEASAGGALLETPEFEESGIVPLGYTALAFAVAATAGLLSRSTLAGIVSTIAVFAVVLFSLAVLVRPHYLPPLTATFPLDQFGTPDGAWGLDYTYLGALGEEVSPTCPSNSTTCTASQFLRATYQPSERYWPFQLIESAILAVLTGATLTLGRTRLRHLAHAGARER
ncbi:hypothetical protein ACL02T_19670 [Pseudonocardia sp. RS010]|uniref:hypothetical protein n=1 Tax=Pseudonocardia sp. RS010 TaxID=3385979 RepID=UPI0039A22AF6